MRASGAEWATARSLCPTEEYGTSDWHTHFTEQPDVLLQMLGDVFRVYKSEQRKTAGTSNPQGGRRRNHIEGTLDELLEIVQPKFSLKPFPEAFRELLGDRTVNSVAIKLGENPRVFRRKVSGQRPLSRYDIEQIAKALGVHPAYFLEWRVETVTTMVANVMVAQPHRSIGFLKVAAR